jgi:multidrug efflux pump subunit AcrA (membrane-fusion protein)
MRRRTVVVNGILGLALVGTGTGAALAIGDPASSAPAARTVKVTTGAVTASVTASGNLAAATAVAVNFTGAAGQVAAIYVKKGDKVTAGQKLAAIDDKAAQQALRSAQAGLASAKAQLQTTTQGQSSADANRSEAGVASAQVAVDNASTAVSQAKATRDLEAKQQAANVAAAQSTLNAATTDSARTQAQTQLQQAKQARDASKLKNDQQVQNAQGQLTAAKKNLAAQQASAEADAQPARDGQVSAAQAQVDNAQVQVDAAETTVANTILKAPVAGTVVSLSGVVGQSSSSTGSSSTSSGTSSGSSGSSSSSSSTASSSSTGFLTIADLTRTSVTAMVAEADASKVKTGQKATVSFSAAGVSASGIVSAIDLVDTVTSNVVQYGVTVTLTDPQAALRIGQTASVSITTSTKSGVLTVPNAAITTAGPVSTITVQKDGTNKAIPITKGIAGDSATEISGDVHEGDTVVLPAAGGAGGGAGFTLPGGVGGLGGGVGR